jgi:hypothetical protein
MLQGIMNKAEVTQNITSILTNPSHIDKPIMVEQKRHNSFRQSMLHLRCNYDKNYASAYLFTSCEYLINRITGFGEVKVTYRPIHREYAQNVISNLALHLYANYQSPPEYLNQCFTTQHLRVASSMEYNSDTAFAYDPDLEQDNITAALSKEFSKEFEFDMSFLKDEKKHKTKAKHQDDNLSALVSVDTLGTKRKRDDALISPSKPTVQTAPNQNSHDNKQASSESDEDDSDDESSDDDSESSTDSTDTASQLIQAKTKRLKNRSNHNTQPAHPLPKPSRNQEAQAKPPPSQLTRKTKPPAAKNPNPSNPTMPPSQRNAAPSLQQPKQTRATPHPPQRTAPHTPHLPPASASQEATTIQQIAAITKHMANANPSDLANYVVQLQNLLEHAGAQASGSQS